MAVATVKPDAVQKTVCPSNLVCDLRIIRGSCHHTPHPETPLPCYLTDQTSCFHPCQIALYSGAAGIRPSAIGAETSGHSDSAARKAGGVAPVSEAMTVSARADHASMSSRWRIAVGAALSIDQASGPIARPEGRRSARPLPHPWPPVRRPCLSPRLRRSGLP